MLQDAAEKAKAALTDVPGVADLAIIRAGELAQTSVTIDRSALAHFNLDLADVQDYLETGMAGHAASEFWEGEKRWDVTVRLPPSTRHDAGSIRSMLLPLQDGALIPVSAVADVRMGSGRAAITRHSRLRTPGRYGLVRARARTPQMPCAATAA